MTISGQAISRELNWPHVTESLRPDQCLEILIHPADSSLPPIQMLFCSSENEQHLLHVAFGSWHDHFDYFNEPVEDLRYAMAFIKRLMDGKAYLQEHLDSTGKAIRSAMIDHHTGSTTGDLLAMVSPTTSTRTLYFGKRIQ